MDPTPQRADTDENPPEYSYWAFISYSHQDEQWAAWLHKSLETYPVPQNLVGREERDFSIPKKIFPVFRDREELPTSADLGQQINLALAQSRYLIVICSPRSATSLWVNEEIKHFKAMGRENRVLAVIVDGEPNATDKPDCPVPECFPPALRYHIGPDGESTGARAEPIAADAREDKDGKANARLKVIAGVLGVGFDALKQRERQRRKRRLAIGLSLVSLLFLIISTLGMVSFVKWRESDRRLLEANHNLGLAFNERTQKVVKIGAFNHARLYSLHALGGFGAGAQGESPARALGTIINSLGVPTLCLPAGKEMGHTNTVTCVSFSPDGRTLASASSDTTIRLWNVASGKETAVLQGHQVEVSSVTFSPDGRTLASASEDKTIRLWDVATGKEKAVLQGHQNKVSSVSFSPDGETLASGDADKPGVDSTIRLWDVATGKEKTVLQSNYGVHIVSFSPDGRTLASGHGELLFADSCIIRLWDVASGKERTVLRGHNGWVRWLSFSSDSQTLASASEDKTVRLWDVATGKETKVLNEPETLFRNVRFSPSGKILAATEDKIIFLWNAATGKLILTLEGYERITSINFAPDGHTLVSAGGKAIRLWDLTCLNKLRPLRGHTDWVHGVSFAPDGQTLASAGDKTIRLWDVATGREKAVLQGHEDPVNSVSFSPDGQTLASASEDQTIRLWDVSTGKQKMEMEEIRASFGRVSFSPDGRTLASTSGGSINLWEIATGKKKAVLQGHEDHVSSLSFSPDGHTLASGSWDGTIRLWEVATRKERAVLQVDKRGVTWVSFSPDGQTLASALNENAVILWEVATAKKKAELQGHIHRVLSVGFAPDGRTLASISMDQSLRLWDVATGKITAVLPGHTYRYLSLNFSPDGQTLASAGDKVIHLWDLTEFYELTRSHSYEPFIRKAEQQYNLRLKDLVPKPLPLEEARKLWEGVPWEWSRHHPYHWLPQAEKGEVEAMFQLGLIYDRARQNNLALTWYEKAKAAGHPQAQARLDFLNSYLARKAQALQQP